MTDYREAFILALLGISILAVPAASEEIAINREREQGFVKTITSDIGDTFAFRSSQARRELEIADQKSRIKSISTPESSIYTVQSSEGRLKTYTSANLTYRRVETPYGTLKTGYRNGKKFAEFEGYNRSRVEKVKQELEELLRQKKQMLQRRKQAIIENRTADIRIREDFDAGTINITNLEDSMISLESWKLKSTKSAKTYRGTYTFSNVTLGAGSSLALSVGEEESDRGFDSTTAIRLYDYGDKLTLTDEWGNNVTSYRYD